MVRLPAAQHNLIRLWVLGGINAIGKHSTKSVSPLIRAGYLDRNGPTPKAMAYITHHEHQENKGA